MEPNACAMVFGAGAVKADGVVPVHCCLCLPLTDEWRAELKLDKGTVYLCACVNRYGLYVCVCVHVCSHATCGGATGISFSEK